MTKPWPLVKLGEVLHRADRFEPKNELDEYQFAGTYSYARGVFVGERKPGATFSLPKIQRIFEGDFVYCKIMAWEGAFGIVPRETHNCVLSGAFAAYEIDRQRLEPKFIDYFFKVSEHWRFIGSQSTGTNVRRQSLHTEQFEQCVIPIPPLAEQQRVVARIEAMAQQIREAQQLRQRSTEEADALHYSVMKKMRLELSNSAYPKAKLGSLTKVSSGGTPSRDNPTYWGGSIPWIKTGELLDRDIISSEEQITELGVANSSAKVFPPDTILIALYGQGQTRGRTGRLMLPATTNQACCAVLPNLDVFEPRFIQLWLRSLYHDLREEAQGGAQPNWNGSMIKNLEIAVPPLAEQHRLVAELDALQAQVDAMKRAQAETAVELDALLPSILAKAFRGEL